MTGHATGKCSRCGRTYHAKRPAVPVYCDCYLYCPNDGAAMEPYSPDLSSPRFYEKGSINIFYRCPKCGHLSDKLPVEVVMA